MSRECVSNKDKCKAYDARSEMWIWMSMMCGLMYRMRLYEKFDGRGELNSVLGKCVNVRECQKP